VLNRTAFLIAGLVGEAVLDPRGYRSGSSLDEVTVSQYLIAALHEREGLPGHPSELWALVWRWTATVIKHNTGVAREIASRLAGKRRIEGKPLARLLERVRPIPFNLEQLYGEER
jgi:hypothetical protein